MAQEAILIESSSESDVEDSSDYHRKEVQKDCARHLQRLSPSSERQGALAGSSTTSATFRRSPDVSPLTIDDSVDDSSDFLGRSESEEPVTCGGDRDALAERSPPADAMLFHPKGENAPVTCDGGSAAAADGNCSDESDDGDFYTRSVSDTFAKRQLSAAARVKVPPPAKKSRLVDCADSSSPPESPGHVSSLDESDEEKPTRDPSVVRTPSPPPKLEPSSGSKRRRPAPVSSALRELQRYMMDDSKEAEASTAICEITSPVETKMPRRTVFLLVKLHSLTEKFRIGTDEQLASVISKLADKEGVSPMRILLYFNDVQVAPDDTPASLGLKAGDTLDCVTVPFEGDAQLKSISCASEDRVQLKVQDCCGQRSRIVMSVGRKEPLKSLMMEFAQRKGVSLDSLVFHFDGEELPATATCEDVGLEDDFCIDVTAK